MRAVRRLLPQPRDRWTRKLEALCVPGSAPKGCGLSLPVSRATFAASTSPLAAPRANRTAHLDYEGAFPLGGPPAPGGFPGAAARSWGALRPGDHSRPFAVASASSASTLPTTSGRAGLLSAGRAEGAWPDSSSRQPDRGDRGRGGRGPSKALTARTLAGAQYTTALHRALSPNRAPRRITSPG